MLAAGHIGRYKDLALLLTRYGRKDFRSQTDPMDGAPASEDRPLEPDVQARARAFAAELKRMGPAYVKFGQVLSTRPDIVPPEYIAALESFQDKLEPFSFDVVEEIVQSELRAKIAAAFDVFEPVPLAAASLGQVHRAVLRDGLEVAVKVQRPGMRELIEKDLDVLDEIARTLEAHTDLGRRMNLAGTVRQLRTTLLNELDYRLEARNTAVLRRNLWEYRKIHIPAVVQDYSSARVLTTELVYGKKVSQLTGYGLLEHDYARLAAVLTRAYLKQICVDGFWHCDPHPGNVFLRDGGIVLIDFGMVARIGSDFQDHVVEFLLGVTGNRGREVADVCLRMGRALEDFDRDKFTSEAGEVVAQYHGADFRQVNTGQLIFRVIGLSRMNGLQVPSELALLAKTLIHLDGITRKLDPHFNPQTVIREYAEQLIARKVRQRLNPRNFYAPLLELNQLALDLPRRLREFMDQLDTGKLSLGLKLNQADDLLNGMHKIANRITVGLITASLVVSSSLVLRAGYEGLAVGGYVTAGVLGLWVLLSTMRLDHRDRNRAKSKINK